MPRRPAVLPRAELEIARGRARNVVRSIDGLAYLIGAADDNDLVLADEQFPDSHSYLLRSPLGLTLCWLGEGPEITIDGTPVLSAASVPDGARLRTGPYEFRIRLTWPVADEATEESADRAGDFPRSPTRPEIVTADTTDAAARLWFPTVPTAPSWGGV